MGNTLSFILLQGHKERLRTAAYSWSPKFAYAAGNPTLYTAVALANRALLYTGVLHESLAHDCLKAYVCILYASPCAPLLVLWPGEVERTSLAMAQGKASPVPAPAPMFRVSAVLRRYDADVPPTRDGRRRDSEHAGMYLQRLCFSSAA